MRGGARIGCVVNGAAGRETMFAKAKPPHGERIAVIGAGPAGLTYASLVADDNAVTVFEKDAVAGGSFRYAGKAPAVSGSRGERRASFQRYIADMVAACELKKGSSVLDRRQSVGRNDSPDLITSSLRRALPTGSASDRTVIWALDTRYFAPAGLRAAVLIRQAAQLVLLPRTARHRRRASRHWRGRDKRSRSSVTLCAPAKANRQFQVRLTQRCAEGERNRSLDERSDIQGWYRPHCCIPDVASLIRPTADDNALKPVKRPPDGAILALVWTPWHPPSFASIRSA